MRGWLIGEFKANSGLKVLRVVVFLGEDGLECTDVLLWPVGPSEEFLSILLAEARLISNLLVPSTSASIGHKVQASPKIFRLHKLLIVREDSDTLVPV
ncbi:hypothetical protein PanWU01x14_246290 [Parasponia andersonii]|uniref:Uncharacterized protein n=1 Tax=Parasponia andersonii TaxID=3476 RepID=A0A2P5BEN4_PARAD|nr:hypothetical protein PanWU01x14_246290 [Parasponia andersonii]